MSPGRRGQLVAILFAAIVGAAVSTVIVSSLLRPDAAGAPPSRVRRLSVVLPQDTEVALARFTERGIGRPSIALSPDGERLAYVARTGGTVRLFLRELDAPDSKLLPETEGAYNPFFSPDGKSIAFFSDGTLKTISILGGQPVSVCEALLPIGGTWGADDTIVVSGYNGTSLWRVRARGGTPEVLLRDVGRSVWPSFLPDGESVLFSGPGGLRALDLGSGEQKVLLETFGSGVMYLPTGHLIFARGGVLMAAPFDLDELRVTGDVVPVLEGLRTENRGAVQYTASLDGTLAYVPGKPMSEGRLVWRGRGPDDRPVEAWPGHRRYGAFELSPDGTKPAVCVRDPVSHVWVYDNVSGQQQKLTHEGLNQFVVWIDDQRVAYRSLRKEGAWVYSRRADGGGTEKLILNGASVGPYSFSREHQVLLVTGSGEAASTDISTVHVDTGELRSVVSTEHLEWGGDFSPDGKWIVYTLEAGGSTEVYVRPYPGPGPDRKLSTGGGEEPIWSPAGDEIFYRNDNRWMVASVATEPELTVQPPTLLFEGNYLNIGGYSYDYDPHHDRFLLVEPHREEPAREIRLVLDWFDELERLVSADAD